MKKIIAVILAIVVVLSLGATCFADWNMFETVPDATVLITDYMWEKGIGPKYNADGTVTLRFSDKVAFTFSDEAIDLIRASLLVWAYDDDYDVTKEIAYYEAFDNGTYERECKPMSTIVEDIYFFGYKPGCGIELGQNVIGIFDQYTNEGIHFVGRADYITDKSGRGYFYDAFAFQLVNGVLEPIYLDGEIDNGVRVF